MSVEVIIPWRGGCAHRERALDWTLRRATNPVTVAEAPPGPWCKAAAVMPAAHASDADIVVIHDADVWTPGLDAAIGAVAAGAPWAVPHDLVLRLSLPATIAVVADTAPSPFERTPGASSLAEPGYRGTRCGGVVVLRRTLLLDVPPDPRFTGWGQEDEAWADALTTLAGAPALGDAPLVHLWHPPQPRATRKRGSADGWALRRRYRRSRGNRLAMRSLVEEARDALRTPHHADHDHHAHPVG